jgi:hypothetical protein
MRSLIIELLLFGASLFAIVVQISSGVAISPTKPIERDEQPGLFWCMMLFEAAMLAILTLVAVSRWARNDFTRL